MWQAALTKGDLFFALSIWKRSSPYQGPIAVGFAYFHGIEASNFFSWVMG